MLYNVHNIPHRSLCPFPVPPHTFGALSISFNLDDVSALLFIEHHTHFQCTVRIMVCVMKWSLDKKSLSSRQNVDSNSNKQVNAVAWSSNFSFKLLKVVIKADLFRLIKKNTNCTKSSWKNACICVRKFVSRFVHRLAFSILGWKLENFVWFYQPSQTHRPSERLCAICQGS